MNQGQQRIPCPKCRANNFLGQTNCWQCGASLPPPEAAGTAQNVGFTMPNQPIPNPPQLPSVPYRAPGSAAMLSLPAGRPKSGVNWFYIRIGLLAVTLVGMLVTASWYSRMGRQIQGIDSDTQKAIEQIDQMNRAMGEMIDQSQPSSPGALDPDSVESRARREMERLQRQHGIANPPLGPDGKVHLQSGGSLDLGDYNRARETLQNPP